MTNIPKLKKNHYILLIFVILNISLSESKLRNYPMEIRIDEIDGELPSFVIKNDDVCQEWIPSLLSPILLVDQSKNIEDYLDHFPINNIRSYFKRLDAQTFTVSFFYFTFLNDFHPILGKTTKRVIEECYIGLSSGNCFYNELEEDFILLNRLKNNNETTNRIFSFDKWVLGDKLITSQLYFGDSHDNFVSKKENGIIGSCKANNSDPFWGCNFDTISFKGNEVPLKNSTHKYKVYFSSENHEILFPKSFNSSFMNLTDYHCGYNSDHYSDYQYFVNCDNFYIDTNTVEFNLTNENMTITVEIDSLSRYYSDTNKKNYTRIRFEDIDFFIFPLIMFKNFHIEFNKEKELISFYTENSSILYIIEKNENNNTPNNRGSSGLKTFLIIFFILLFLVLVLGIIWYIKKRRGSVEKNINKYNKFDEDDDNFQNMNQKVF
jgi:hypothetical protein